MPVCYRLLSSSPGVMRSMAEACWERRHVSGSGYMLCL